MFRFLVLIAITSFSTTTIAFYHWANEIFTQKTAGSFFCGHYAFFRTAQLRGISLSPDQIQGELNSINGALSMNDLAQAFMRIGLKPEIRNDALSSLDSENCPMLIHLNSPQHFAVISGVDKDKETVWIYDNSSRPKKVLKTDLMPRLSGYWIETRLDKSVSGIISETNLVDTGAVPMATAMQNGLKGQFSLINRTGSPIRILNMLPGCKCITVEASTLLLGPGEKSVITAKYSQEAIGKSGEFVQDILVETDFPSQKYVGLQLTGYVTGRASVTPDLLRFSFLAPGKIFAGYFLVDTPRSEKGDLPEITTGLSGDSKNFHVSVVPASIDEYNAYFSQKDPAFFPIQASSDLKVLRVQVETPVLDETQDILITATINDRESDRLERSQLFRVQISLSFFSKGGSAP